MPHIRVVDADDETNFKHASASSADDDTGSLRHRAASRSRNDSGEIPADRVLHVQRFTLPLRLIAAAPAAPRSPPTAHRRADERTPPATSPRRRGRGAGGPGSSAPCPTPGPGLGRTGPVGVRQGGTDLLDPLGQVRTGRRLSTAHAMVPRLQPSLAPMSVTEPAGRVCMAVLVSARHGHDRATGLTQSRRSRFADGDSAGIPPNTIQHSVTGTTLPRPGRCCTRCIAVLYWISRALRKVMRGRR
jgi:hypothetical protein